MTTPLETVPLRLARHATRALTLQEKAQLMSELAQEIAQATPLPHRQKAHDGLARFKTFAAEFRASYPSADVTARLMADRQERDTSLRGENADVHP